MLVSLKTVRKRRIVRAARDAAAGLAHRKDPDLAQIAVDLRWQCYSGKPAPSDIALAFGLVMEATRRVLGIQFHPNQVFAGACMLDAIIVEMQTGEGKTLAALLPAFVRALAGNGCHVLTANDYLARRDADLARSILGLLNISVGSVSHVATEDERRAAYACDITYGTVREFAFDYLRDRMRLGPQRCAGDMPSESFDRSCLQRGLYAAVVDEADSIMIDQACTPMLISGSDSGDEQSEALLRWSSMMAEQLIESGEFQFDVKRRLVRLTETGRQRILFAGQPVECGHATLRMVVDAVEQAIVARQGFVRDRDYVVIDQRVQIVDESTGRILDGRKWQDGLQEAIELKEGVALSRRTTSLASITVQRFLNQYQHVAGMTGTAVPARFELQKVYGLKVMSIPTHRRRIVREFPARVFATQRMKWDFVAFQVSQMLEAGRPVLVGTPSISASEALGEVLESQGISSQLLHARQDNFEAEIIGTAGQAGRVTIATNMAGRGTDIATSAEVNAAGGLHVIATELHSSSRIDRQLIGRTGRQGNPGSHQLAVSLEDGIVETLSSHVQDRLRRSARPSRNGELPSRYLNSLRAAQRQLERHGRQQRWQLMKLEQAHSQRCRQIGLEPVLEFA